MRRGRPLTGARQGEPAALGTHDRALPAAYAQPAEIPDDLRPTPGLVASEYADPHLSDDMRAINEHWRRRGKRGAPAPRKAS